MLSKRRAGTGSLRTGLKLEDTPRTDFGGLGLEEAWPWLEALAWTLEAICSREFSSVLPKSCVRAVSFTITGDWS